ncbi:MAG TPA: glycosyltransferase family 2 protein [Pseudonocardiaceae bacterium]|nr:glycosyltransferase family 2 protein [Pseudonocardiaceae bacterium]
MNVPDVSVVICAYTERRWVELLRAIDSAAEQQPGPAEILVVVDHNPALAERLRSHVDSSVTVTENTRQRGLSGARNTALAQVKGEVIAFLDDDAYAGPGWLAALTAPFGDPDVHAVGGAATPVWPGERPVTLPARRGGGATPVRGELDWVVGCTYHGQPRTLAQVRNVMGCNMAFRASVFSRVGGFTEGIGRVGTLPLGCEETELCIRLRHADRNVRILFEPAALVHHQVSADRLSWSYLRRRSYAEGVSKAAIAKLVGADDALSTERAYTSRIIPLAVLRELASGGLRGAFALVLSVFSAAFGYLRGRDVELAKPEAPAPIAMGEVDLADAESGVRLCPVDAPVAPESARVLVRRGPTVLGEVDLALRDGIVSGNELTAAIDGLPPVEPVPAGPYTPMVSVVIPSAGRPDTAIRCARSILATGYPNLEILLVDNRPGTANSVPLKEFFGSDPMLRYVEEPVAGASNARNRGAAEASGEIIAFTDDDAVVDHHWVSAIVAEFADPDVDCVTGLVLPLALDTPAQRWFENWGGFGKGLARRRFTSAGVDGPVRPDESARLGLYPFAAGLFGSGNSMAWRATAYRQLGGCDPLLGPGTPTGSGEDLELFIRLIRGGGTLVYSPHAMVRHEHRREAAALAKQMYSYGTGLFPMFAVYVGRRPAEALAVLRRLPAGLRHTVADDSERNAGRGEDFPAELVRAERRGMLAGPARLVLAALTAPRRAVRLPEPQRTVAQRANEPAIRMAR